ncbi:MAG: hypothetical protein GTO60_14325, partial [Gammaproteobacteria bacterium]|nr:hypothetical protein [Gammaproteobacteria bacterium]
LFAISSINMSTVNLRIVGNMQAVKSLDADAQAAIEEIISSMNSFGSVPAGATITGEIGTVNIAPPVCI